MSFITSFWKLFKYLIILWEKKKQLNEFSIIHGGISHLWIFCKQVFNYSLTVIYPSTLLFLSQLLQPYTQEKPANLKDKCRERQVCATKMDIHVVHHKAKWKLFLD